MEKGYFKQYFEFERNHWWFRARLKILNNYIDQNIPINSKMKILNVGAATGATSEMLKSKGDLISIEFDKDCINFVKDKLTLEVQWGGYYEIRFRG